MNELHFAHRVRQHLNRGLRDIDDNKLARLKAAREAALARQKQPAAIPVLAGAAHFLRMHFENLHARQLLAGLALLAALAFYANWQANQIVADMTETDSALLTDDMPVEALTSKEFQSWLKNSSGQ